MSVRSISAVAAGDENEVAAHAARPRHEPAVVEADDELHLHLDRALDPVHEADQVGVRRAQGHEVGDARDARVGLPLGLEHQRARQ